MLVDSILKVMGLCTVICVGPGVMIMFGKLLSTFADEFPPFCRIFTGT
jgi:hypothetical protein